MPGSSRLIPVLTSALLLAASVAGCASPPEEQPLTSFASRIDATAGPPRYSAFDLDTAQQPVRSDGGWDPSQRYERCDFRPSGKASIVLLRAASDFASVSTAAVGSVDAVTTTIDVIIEPGDRPLYLITMTGGPAIWRFSGDVRRVEAVVLLAEDGLANPEPAHRIPRGSGPEIVITGGRPHLLRQPASWPGQGVVGLAADRVQTIDRRHCPHAPGFLDALVRQRLGRSIETVFDLSETAAVRLPSGSGTRGDRSQARPDGFYEAYWDEALRFNPGGLVSIRARDVVSALPVYDYEILPQEFGLSHLVGQGLIEDMAPNSWSGPARIVAPISRLPPGLAGSHSMPFLLAPGVPVPGGDYGHSCVRVQDTGEIFGLLPLGCQRSFAPEL